MKPTRARYETRAGESPKPRPMNPKKCRSARVIHVSSCNGCPYCYFSGRRSAYICKEDMSVIPSDVVENDDIWEKCPLEVSD